MQRVHEDALTVTTTFTTSNQSQPQTVELKPSFRLSLTLVAIAIPLLWVQPWVSGGIALLGLFLLLQTVRLRLQFTPTDLDIYQGDKLLRRFPYQDWQHWEIFGSRVPVLFYFREVKSIHFLPILFDPVTLRACLERHCPRQSP